MAAVRVPASASVVKAVAVEGWAMAIAATALVMMAVGEEMAKEAARVAMVVVTAAVPATVGHAPSTT